MRHLLYQQFSSSPTHHVDDAENPSITDGNIVPMNTSNRNTRHGGFPSFSQKVIKLGAVFVGLSVIIALGVTFGLQYGSYGGNSSEESAKSSSSAQHDPNIENESEKSSIKSNDSPIQTSFEVPHDDSMPAINYVASFGPLQARVKMMSSSVIDGYETCDDFESDITEALKLYMNKFIKHEAALDIYANCDPDKEDWMSELVDDYSYYYDYNNDDFNFDCSPVSNTTFCVTDDAQVPYVVLWHEIDHVKGKIFYNETEARIGYENVTSSWAKRLYDPTKSVVEEYGWMSPSEWCQFETWAFEAQCNGVAPIGTAETPNSTKRVKRHPMKRTRSNAPAFSVKGHARARKIIGSSRMDKESEDGTDWNNQNDSANRPDRVVSDGVHIFAAYGDVLYAWDAVDATKGVSMTHMPGNTTECNGNVTPPCTFSSKPKINALFLGENRLTVVGSNLIFWMTPYSEIDNLDTKVHVQIYDIVDVPLDGSPLKKIGDKELAGTYFNGRSIGNEVLLTTFFDIDPYSSITQDLWRSQEQYCGLDTDSYIELAGEVAMEIATKQVDSYVKQMVAKFDLSNDCSKIFQVAARQSTANQADFSSIPHSTKEDILGKFVRVSTFDMSFDFDADGGDIPLKVAGAFTGGEGWEIYLADDFLAIPTTDLIYNYSSEVSFLETNILGFDLSSKEGATPFCYGRVPGQLYTHSYRMDKWDAHLRLSMVDYHVETWSTIHKIYVLEIPSAETTSREMSLVGEINNIGVEIGVEGLITGMWFNEDKAYGSMHLLTAGMNDLLFFVVDLLDHSNPHLVGLIENTGSPLYYLRQVKIEGNPFVVGIGHGADESGQYAQLSLFDVSTPSSPKMRASFRDIGETELQLQSSLEFLTIRFLPDSNTLILPVSKPEYGDDVVLNHTSSFTVFNVSSDLITPVFNVTHSMTDFACWYDANLPKRSFVIDSKLITIWGHSVLTTEMWSGEFISELDLDVGLNYSQCTPHLYPYDYPHYNGTDDGFGYTDNDDIVDDNLSAL